MMRASVVLTALLISILTVVSALPAAPERFPSSVPETAAAEIRTLILCTPNPVAKHLFPATVLI